MPQKTDKKLFIRSLIFRFDFGVVSVRARASKFPFFTICVCCCWHRRNANRSLLILSTELVKCKRMKLWLNANCARFFCSLTRSPRTFPFAPFSLFHFTAHSDTEPTTENHFSNGILQRIAEEKLAFRNGTQQLLFARVFLFFVLALSKRRDWRNYIVSDECNFSRCIVTANEAQKPIQVKARAAITHTHTDRPQYGTMRPMQPCTNQRPTTNYSISRFTNNSLVFAIEHCTHT